MPSLSVVRWRMRSSSSSLYCLARYTRLIQPPWVDTRYHLPLRAYTPSHKLVLKDHGLSLDMAAGSGVAYMSMQASRMYISPVDTGDIPLDNTINQQVMSPDRYPQF